MSAGIPAALMALLFLDGLTVVCLVGNALLFGVFAFLFVIERKMNKQMNKE